MMMVLSLSVMCYTFWIKLNEKFNLLGLIWNIGRPCISGTERSSFSLDLVSSSANDYDYGTTEYRHWSLMWFIVYIGL